MAQAAAAGVDGVISISTTVPDAVRVAEVASQHARVWCSAGVHPLYADEGPHDWGMLAVLAAKPKCVAWGELGLDNHYSEPAKDIQRRVLDEQLACISAARGKGIDKPIILHCREAFADLVPILKASGLPTEKMVFHCFTGTPSDMRLLLDIGSSVSFTGVITYKNAASVREAMLMAPIDRMMIETDAPFLPPEPHRSQRPCTPAMSRITAEFVAAQRGMTWPEFHAAINANTKRFFGIESGIESAS